MAVQAVKQKNRIPTTIYDDENEQTNSLERLQYITFLLGGNYVAGYTSKLRYTISRSFPFYEHILTMNGYPTLITQLRDP